MIDIPPPPPGFSIVPQDQQPQEAQQPPAAPQGQIPPPPPGFRVRNVDPKVAARPGVDLDAEEHAKALAEFNAPIRQAAIDRVKGNFNSEVALRESGKEFGPTAQEEDGSTNWGLVQKRSPSKMSADDLSALAIEMARKEGLSINDINPDLDRSRIGDAFQRQQQADQAARVKGLSPMENFSNATLDSMSRVGEGLVGTVAPETANRLHRQTGDVYANDPSRTSGLVGEVAGNTIPMIPAALSGGPMVQQLTNAGFAGSTFGAVRQSIAERRDAGEKISTSQELGAAALSALTMYAANKVSIGAFHGQDSAVFKNAVANAVANYAKTAGIVATDNVILTATNNAIDKFVAGNAKRNISDDVEHAAISGALMGVAGRGVHQLGTAGKPHAVQQDVQQVQPPAPEAPAEAGRQAPAVDAVAPGPQQPADVAGERAAGAKVEPGAVPQEPAGEPRSAVPDELPVLKTEPAPLPPRVEANNTVFRDQEGGVSRAVAVKFDDPIDKAAYAAGYERKGKVSIDARGYLEEHGLSADDIAARTADVQARVAEAAKGKVDETVVIPSKENHAVEAEKPVAEAPVHAAPEADGVRVVGKVGGAEEGATSPEAPRVPAGEAAAVHGARDADGVARGSADRVKAAMESASEHPMLKGIEQVKPRNLEQARLATTIREMTGKDVVFVDGVKPAGFALRSHPDVVFVHTRTKGEGLAETVVHEIHHKVQDQFPELAAEVEKAFPPAAMEAAAKRYAKGAEGKGYAEVASRMSEDAAFRKREAGATLVGMAARNPRVLEGLTGDQRTPLRKLVDKMLEVVGLKKKLSPLEAKVRDNLERVREKLSEAAGPDLGKLPDELSHLPAANEGILRHAFADPESIDGLSVDAKEGFRPWLDRLIENVKGRPDWKSKMDRLDAVREKLGPSLAEVRDTVRKEHPAETAKLEAKGEARYEDVSLLPNPAKALVDQDLKPAVKEAADAVREALTGVQRLVAPQTRGAQAKEAKGSLREMGAERAQRADRLEAAFHEARKVMDKLPTGVTRQFIDDLEHGRPQADKTLQPIADGLRRELDDRLKQVQGLGTGKLTQFVQDYFPHLWEDPKAASAVYKELQAKRPLEGRKGFLKQRTLPLFSDGIAAKLTPVTENPVEAMMLRVREMDKYITAQQTFADMKGKGLMKRVPAAKVYEQEKAGYAKINDSIGTIFGKPSSKGGISVAGYWMAPEPVATVMNNLLSPGLRSDPYFGKAFRGYLKMGGLVNAAQLGFSGFHLTFTAFDAAVGKFALSGVQASRGQFKEAGKSLLSAATVLGPAIQNFRNGSQVLQEWNRPGSTTPEIARIVDAMKAAGGRAKMDDFYKTGMADAMLKAFKDGNALGGIARMPAAAIEATAKPVLEKLVPRMKMGAFFDMAKSELARNPSMNRQQMREAMGKAWDSVDNRLGEMVYDNLFWNKAVKDLSMASVRAVGWNVGTFRELGGGVLDFGTQAKNLATGKQAELTHRMAYVAALPVLTGLIGGLAHYLATGKRPEEYKDWFFPKTGEKDKSGHDIRLTMPGYMGDVLKYGGDVKTAVQEERPGALVTTLKHKIHPLLNAGIEMLGNEDYYGVKIRNEDDPIVKQVLDTVKHGASTLVPFGARDVKKLTEEGQGAKALLPLAGITRARQDVINSDAENMAGKLVKEKMPQGARTQAEADKSKLIVQLADALHAKEADANDKIREAVKSGQIQFSDVQQIRHDVKYPTRLERSVSRLDSEQAMKVWAVATPQERREIGKQMFDKLREAKALPPERKKALLEQFRTDWAAVKDGGS